MDFGTLILTNQNSKKRDWEKCRPSFLVNWFLNFEPKVVNGHAFAFSVSNPRNDLRPCITCIPFDYGSITAITVQRPLQLILVTNY